MRLVTADVDRYGPLSGCRPPCDDGITVVAGPNESGKTLYLEALLQLLEPDVSSQLEPPPRVADAPTGRVVVDDGADHHALGDGTALSDVSRIDPPHLQTLFVVRDGDLALPDGSTYYRSLVEHLGDVHTTEIEAIREGLVDEGLLTPVELDLRDREHDTKTVRNRFESLADEIDATIEDAADEGIDELSRRRLSLCAERRQVERELDAQRTAKELAAIEDAADQLARYRTATDVLENARVDRETLTTLRERKRDLAHARDRLAETESALEADREALARHREALADARERHAARVQRRADVDRLEDELERYRDREFAAPDDDVLASRLAQRRAVAVAGIVGAGLAGAAGAVADAVAAVALGVALLSVGVGGWLSHRRLASRAAGADTLERELLRTARDAGFDAESAADVPVLLREYRDDLDGIETRIHELETHVEGTSDRIEELEATRREESATVDRIVEQVGSTLAAADVDSVEAYQRRLEAVEAHERRRSQAASLLSMELGEPDADAPEAAVAFWEAALADRRAALDGRAADVAKVGNGADVAEPGVDADIAEVRDDTDVVAPGAGGGTSRADGDVAKSGEDIVTPEADADGHDTNVDVDDGHPTVDAGQYDPDTLDRLANRRETLETELEAVESELEAFRSTLDEFERRARELSAPPIVERTPSLEARTLEGLAELAEGLRAVADRIDENAAISRKAIDVLDSIAADEQRKVATLFDPDGPASETLAYLTDGRYTAVEYDPDERSLAVRRTDGRAFAPAQLSQATRDQLYFAARLSLARQLLGDSPGFLLLDDPFLAADHDRLRCGFETLTTLADDGWQILYLTAKREVAETMVDEFDCPVYELEALDR